MLPSPSLSSPLSPHPHAPLLPLLPPHPPTPFLPIVLTSDAPPPIVHGTRAGGTHHPWHPQVCHTGGLPPLPRHMEPSDPPHGRAAITARAHGALRSATWDGRRSCLGPWRPQMHRMGGPPLPQIHGAPTVTTQVTPPSRLLALGRPPPQIHGTPTVTAPLSSFFLVLFLCRAGDVRQQQPRTRLAV
jgi:hypothetical protein